MGFVVDVAILAADPKGRDVDGAVERVHLTIMAFQAGFVLLIFDIIPRRQVQTAQQEDCS